MKKKTIILITSLFLANHINHINVIQHAPTITLQRDDKFSLFSKNSYYKRRHNKLALKEKEFLQKLENYKKILVVDKVLNDNFEELRNKKHFSSFSYLVRKIQEISGVTPDEFDFTNVWTNFIKQSLSNIKEKNVKEKDLQKFILQFYNFVGNIVPFERNRSNDNNGANLFRLTLGFEIAESNMIDKGSEAETTNSIHYQAILFKDTWLSPSRNLESYKNGQFSVPSQFSTFVHEFGHLLNYYVSLSSYKQKEINTFKNKNFKFKNINEAIKIYNQKIPEDDVVDSNGSTSLSITNHFLDFLVEKATNLIYPNNAGQSVYSEVYSYLIYYNVINSLYPLQEYLDPVSPLKLNKLIAENPRVNKDLIKAKLEEEKMITAKEEFFAEAFAAFYLTPVNERNIFWTWLYEYFVNIFKGRYFV